MIVSLRRFTFAVPRRAWHVVKARKAKAVAEKAERQGLLQSFETMLEQQVNLTFRDVTDFE